MFSYNSLSIVVLFVKNVFLLKFKSCPKFFKKKSSQFYYLKGLLKKYFVGYVVSKKKCMYKYEYKVQFYSIIIYIF